MFWAEVAWACVLAAATAAGLALAVRRRLLQRAHVLCSI